MFVSSVRWTRSRMARSPTRQKKGGRDNGHEHIVRHRPRGAAARWWWILLQTQGWSREGGSLAGIIRRPADGRRTLQRAAVDHPSTLVRLLSPRRQEDMAVEGTRTMDPARRQMQVRVAALTFMMFTAATALGACGI